MKNILLVFLSLLIGCNIYDFNTKKDESIFTVNKGIRSYGLFFLTDSANCVLQLNSLNENKYLEESESFINEISDMINQESSHNVDTSKVIEITNIEVVSLIFCTFEKGAMVF